MNLRSLVLAGLLAGLLGGATAALLIPHHAARAHATATSPLSLGPTRVLRVGVARRHDWDVRLRLLGRPRVEMRARDPLGGPAWAVRVFRANRVLAARVRRRGEHRVIGHDLCAQLGRLFRGRFGWLDAAGTFRPTLPQLTGATWCGSRLPDLHGSPWYDALSTITQPTAPAARVKSSVVWGIAGAAARRVSLRLGGRTFRFGPTHDGAFLAVVAGERRPGEHSASIRYADGHRVVAPVAPMLPGFPFGVRHATRWPLAARAPDPNGGLPFALVATHTSDGRWCTFTGPRVVGDRSGGVDYQLDVLREIQPGGGGGCTQAGHARSLFHGHPVLLTSAGGASDLAPETDVGTASHVARRTLPGTTVLAGIAAPGVVAVTLETPRDVRTLVPSGPAHAIIAVYDGSFPTGSITVTARFRDGRTHTEKLPEMGL